MQCTYRLYGIYAHPEPGDPLEGKMDGRCVLERRAPPGTISHPPLEPGRHGSSTTYPSYRMPLSLGANPYNRTSSYIPHTLCCRHTQSAFSFVIHHSRRYPQVVHSRSNRQEPLTQDALSARRLRRSSLASRPSRGLRHRPCTHTRLPIHLPIYLPAHDGTRRRRAIGPGASSGLRFCCASCAGIASG